MIKASFLVGYAVEVKETHNILGSNVESKSFKFESKIIEVESNNELPSFAGVQKKLSEELEVNKNNIKIVILAISRVNP